MEVSLASPPNLQHIYLKLLVTLIVNLLVVNKKNIVCSRFLTFGVVNLEPQLVCLAFQTPPAINLFPR